jgi:hypothetical protein
MMSRRWQDTAGQVRVFLLDNAVMLQIECDDGLETQAALTPENARIVARRLEQMAYQIEQGQIVTQNTQGGR